MTLEKKYGKKIRKGTIALILGFIKRMQEDHIGAYAAQAAYFLIMSFIPFVLVLTALVQYTPLTYRMLRQAIIGFVPDNLQDFVLKIIAEYLLEKRRSCTDFRTVCTVVIGKGHAVTHCGTECDLSRKGYLKLADKQIVFYAVYVSVCYCNHYKSAASGYG